MAVEDLVKGRVSGQPLKALARMTRNPAVAQVAVAVLKRELGMEPLAALVDGPLHIEPDVSPRRAREERSRPPADQRLAEPPSWASTCTTLTTAYREGTSDPEQVLQRLYREADATSERQPYLRCILTRDVDRARTEARESAQRYTDGKPLGPLDGVPVLVKEQVAVKGLPHRTGGNVSDDAPAPADSTLVARLRAAGCVIAGQTTMTELGMSPIGVNPCRPPLRNPHHFDRTAGGSSTGSGVAVAVGLTPLAVGADGGGSVRIPSAICGVFGLKPTYGRVSRAGDAFSGSVSHVGPLGTSTLDLALFLDAVCGPDPADPASLHAPPVTEPFVDALRRGVKGLRIGVDESQWQQTDPAIADAGERALAALVEAGAQRVDVRIPLLEHALGIGVTTISTEACAMAQHDYRRDPNGHGADLQVFLNAAGQLDCELYFTAQALREKLRLQVAEVLRNVDVLALPTTASAALPVNATEEKTGRMDAAGVAAMTRHCFMGNLTGLPAASVPVGQDRDGLPLGFQIVGDAWDEASVLSVMATLERSGIAQLARPPHHIDLLQR